MDDSRFPLGQVLATPAALKAVPAADITAALARHARGDWGDVCEEDKRANDGALIHGSRLLSVYPFLTGEEPTDSEPRKFWIITEADRASTTVLLPEDY